MYKRHIEITEMPYTVKKQTTCIQQHKITTFKLSWYYKDVTISLNISYRGMKPISNLLAHHFYYDNFILWHLQSRIRVMLVYRKVWQE
jgi:hypothetical protein